MHYLLFIFAFIWFAFIAPLKVTLAICLSLILITSIVKATATAIVGSTSFRDSFKSVGLAFMFLGIALFTLISFSKGAEQGAPILLVLSGFLVAYILGFKVGLGASFGASAIIAAVSTTVSGALFFCLKPLLS